MPELPKSPPSNKEPDASAVPGDNTVSPADDPDAPTGTLPGQPQFATPARSGELGTFGRYRVLQKLGQGGMGAVYLGFDAALDRKVALKVMLPKFAAEPDARERFLREARTAAMVRSDHVVTIFDVGEERGAPFIAMEYLLGYPLDKFLREKGELPLAQVLRVCRETAIGLAAAHALGMVHRDIKPANLWLEAPRGRVKLLDFGLARIADDDTQLTGSGAVVGTPAYMSPEQGRGLKVDHRTDLFSVGVVLYRLATGKMPFAGATTMGLLTSLAVDTPTPPRQLNPQLPVELDAVITRLLAKNPDDRFGSARELADALREIERPSLRTDLARLPAGTIRDLFDGHLPVGPGGRKLGANPRPASILALKGDAKNGEALFFNKEMKCANCHKLGDKGVALGPDLSAIGKARTRPELLDSLLNPSARVEPQFAAYNVRTKDEKTYTGIVTKRDEKQLVLRDAENKEVALAGDNVESVRPSRVSLMPDGQMSGLTPQEAADLLDYLVNRR